MSARCGRRCRSCCEREKKAIVARLLELTRGAACEVRRNAVSPGAECKGLSGRAARCACVRVDARLDGMAGKGSAKGIVPSLAAAGAGGGAGLAGSAWDSAEFREAVEFLYTVRCFLHYRHERDDNTLDWQAQDAAARAAIGLEKKAGKKADCGVLDEGVLPACAEY